MRSSVAPRTQMLLTAVGMSFVWPYFRASFLSFLTVFSLQPSSAVHVAYVAYAVAFAVATIAVLFATPAATRALNTPRARLVLGLLGALGNAALWCGLPEGFSSVVCGMGSVAATAFFVGAVMGYGTALASWNDRRAAITAFASFGICFFDNLALASPAPIAALFCIGGPLVCMLCMPTAGPANAHAEPASAFDLRSHGPLAALIILLALFCLTGNVVRGLTNPWFASSAPTVRSLYMSLANLVFAAISIAFFARGAGVRKVLFWNWTACMALFFAGLLALVFLPTPLASVGSDVATVSRVCFTLLMFLFALAAQHGTDAEPQRLLGLFLLMPEALSALVRHVVLPPLLVMTGTEPLVAASRAGIGIILVLMVAIIVVLGNLLLRQMSDQPKAMPSAEPATPDKGQLLEEMARTYGLTAREVQTASYVSKGYSLEKTAELLGISINTVRTHMRSVYGKLAIHSRQELIDLLDRQAG